MERHETIDGPPTHAPAACSACGANTLVPVGETPTYTRTGTISDHLHRCRSCGTYMRALDYDHLAALGHFEVASYTNPATRERHLADRREFFRMLVRLSSASLESRPEILKVLDFGSAFGGLLDCFHEQGAETYGVEIVAHCRQAVADRPHTVVATEAELPPGLKFHIVTMIDSLYCVQDPLGTLETLRRRLHPGGVLILRITNRTPLFNLLRLSGRTISEPIAGDAKHHFTHRGIRALLRRAGYAVDKVCLREQGKKHHSRKTALIYTLSLFASTILRVKLTPGMIVVARPVRTT